MRPLGYLALILHAHLPYVRHPEYDDFLEERWLFEAVAETYLPLVDAFQRLAWENVPFRVTMSISPTLASMLEDGLLIERTLRHLSRTLELAEKEVERTAGDAQFAPLAQMYRNWYSRAMEIYAGECDGRLLHAFLRLRDAGRLEIITCAATHGFLPLLVSNDRAIRRQVEIAARFHEMTFGEPPKGIWLPECGYYPGVDRHLADNGIGYFICDSHTLRLADPTPVYDVYAPVYTPRGVAAFGRDPESSKSVWSAEEGYPGDTDYREFYRDVGFDMPLEYVAPYIHLGETRINTGIKYYRITGRTAHKQPYSQERAKEKAAAHAGNFLFNREAQVRHLSGNMDRRPIIVAPYDAELFGHWWYEGPMWLEYLIRKSAFDTQVYSLATPGDYLEEYPANQVATPNTGSWGNDGYADVWLESSNEWIYPHLSQMAVRMEDAERALSGRGEFYDRVRRQLERELLLAQASDWPFIMKTGTVVAYAVRSIKTRISNFNRLYGQAMSGHTDEEFLKKLEEKNNIFSPEVLG